MDSRSKESLGLENLSHLNADALEWPKFELDELAVSSPSSEGDRPAESILQRPWPISETPQLPDFIPLDEDLPESPQQATLDHQLPEISSRDGLEAETPSIPDQVTSTYENVEGLQWQPADQEEAGPESAFQEATLPEESGDQVAPALQSLVAAIEGLKPKPEYGGPVIPHPEVETIFAGRSYPLDSLNNYPIVSPSEGMF